MEIKFNKSITTDKSTWPSQCEHVRVLHEFNAKYNYSHIELLEGRVKVDELEDGESDVWIDFGDLASSISATEVDFLWVDSDEFLKASCLELGVAFNPSEWSCI